MKNTGIVELIHTLPGEERVITDVLRQIILSAYPNYIKEKIAYNVPFYYGEKGIAIIWPASVPRGGIKSGVLFGLWHGNKLRDVENYLQRGKNKQVFYRVFQSGAEIDDRPILRLLDEAVRLDKGEEHKL